MSPLLILEKVFHLQPSESLPLTLFSVFFFRFHFHGLKRRVSTMNLRFAEDDGEVDVLLQTASWWLRSDWFATWLFRSFSATAAASIWRGIAFSGPFSTMATTLWPSLLLLSHVILTTPFESLAWLAAKGLSLWSLSTHTEYPDKAAKEIGLSGVLVRTAADELIVCFFFRLWKLIAAGNFGEGVGDHFSDPRCKCSR